MNDDAIHLARLDSPADAFRALCGAWRRAHDWTTSPKLVTCPACLARLAGNGAGHAGASSHAAGTSTA